MEEGGILLVPMISTCRPWLRGRGEGSAPCAVHKQIYKTIPSCLYLLKFLLPEPILAFPATGRVKNRPITTEIKILSALRYFLRKRQGRDGGGGDGKDRGKREEGKDKDVGKSENAEECGKFCT